MAWSSLFGDTGMGSWLGSAANTAAGNTGNYGGGGGGFDWGSVLGIANNVLGSSGGGGGTAAPTSGGTDWSQTISNLFGGGGGSGSTLVGDLFKGILSGVGASAAAKGDLAMAKEVTSLKGLEDRKTTAFEAELLDFYKQRDNVRKFKALDQYGQFSRVSKFAPNYQPTYTGPVDPGLIAPQPKA